jgi:phosphoserine phosphatase
MTWQPWRRNAAAATTRREFPASTTGADAAMRPSLRAPDRRLDRVGLVAFDMDSTLITIECIDEIADLQGIKPQVAAITRARCAARSTSPRACAAASRCSPNSTRRRWSASTRSGFGSRRAPRTMLAAFRAVGATTLLVSGGFTFFTERLKDGLALDHAVSNVLGAAAGSCRAR